MDSKDGDFVAGDEDISEDGEEAYQFRSDAMNHWKDPATTVVPSEVVTVSKVGVQIYESDAGVVHHDIPDPPMIESSEEASYDEDDEGEALRRKSRFARYDSKAAILKFSIGMTFRGREECKKALIKYGQATRNHLRFPKVQRKRDQS